jgi:hypothetical protein
MRFVTGVLCIPCRVASPLQWSARVGQATDSYSLGTRAIREAKRLPGRSGGGFPPHDDIKSTGIKCKLDMLVVDQTEVRTTPRNQEGDGSSLPLKLITL